MGRVRLGIVIAATSLSAGCWLTSSFDDLRAGAGFPEGGADAGSSEASADASSSCFASTYASSVMADTPVSYYRFDEPAGASVAKDSAGSNDANVHGALTFAVPGILPDDGAASFDGKTAYVSGGASPAFVGTASFTLEAWIKPTKIDAEFRGILSNETPTVANRGGYAFWVQQTDAGASNLGFERWASNVNNETLVPNLPVGTWSHVVATFDGHESSLFLNGQLVSHETPATVNSIASGYTFVIGALFSAALPTFFEGTVDEVAIYDHVVSTSCIGAHYRLGLGQPP